MRRKATRSIVWVVIERWSVRFISLGVFIVLARILSPAEFGLIAAATAFLAVAQVIIDSGFSRALIQKKQLHPEDASTAFWSSLALAVVVTVAIVLVAPHVARFMHLPELRPVLQVMAITLPIAALSQTPAALLERDFRFKSLSIRQLIGAGAGAVVAIPLALFGAGVWALVAQMLTSAAVAVVVLWASTSWRPRFVYTWASLKRLWAVGSTVLLIDLLDAVQANIDKLVIAAFFSANELGYYFLAQRIGTILIELFTSVISRVSFTTFSRVQDDPVRLNRIFRQLTFAASAASVPIFGLVALLAPQLVSTVFGSEWLPSVPLIWIMATGWALGAVMYFDRTVLLATNHSITALGLSVFQNAMGIVLVFAFVPLGIFGVALSRLVQIITWPVRLDILRRVAGIRILAYLLQTARCVAAIAPALVAIAFLQGSPWASAFAPLWSFALPLSVAALIAYAALLWGLAGRENRSVLREMVGEARKRLRR